MVTQDTCTAIGAFHSKLDTGTKAGLGNLIVATIDDAGGRCWYGDDRGCGGAGAVTMSGTTTRTVKNAAMAAVLAMTSIEPC